MDVGGMEENEKNDNGITCSSLLTTNECTCEKDYHHDDDNNDTRS